MHTPRITRFDLPAILWLCFILFATLTSTSTLVSLSLSDLFGYDKPIHMFLFGTQVWLTCRAWQLSARSYSISTVRWISAATILLGFSIELLQILITTSRTFDWFDVLANTLGALIAGMIKRRSLLQMEVTKTTISQ